MVQHVGNKVGCVYTNLNKRNHRALPRGVRHESVCFLLCRRVL